MHACISDATKTILVNKDEIAGKEDPKKKDIKTTDDTSLLGLPSFRDTTTETSLGIKR